MNKLFYMYMNIQGMGRNVLVCLITILLFVSCQYHYTGESDYEFNENVLERTAVIKLAVTEWSCKEH